MQQYLQDKIFKIISEAADEQAKECYVIGGYVRDIFLKRESKDIDVVVVGSGIELAEAVAQKLGKKAHLTVFKNFGTAQVKQNDLEVEFVGAGAAADFPGGAPACPPGAAFWWCAGAWPALTWSG